MYRAEEDDNENYIVLGNFGFYNSDEGPKPAAKTLFESIDDENPALTTASFLLAIYSCLESKIPDSKQIKFKEDVIYYLEKAFPKLENITTVK